MKDLNAMPALRPAYALPERLTQDHLLVSSCYQCRKCSGGCPLTFAMDLLPDRVIRLALLGQEDLVLNSRTIWVCSSCYTCSTRCPNDIDIAKVMDWLRQTALREAVAPAEKEVPIFHRA